MSQIKNEVNDNMNNEVILDISGVPPLFVSDKLNNFFKEFKEKYQCKPIKEDTKYMMNLEVEQFKNELKSEYPQYPIVCRLKDQLHTIELNGLLKQYLNYIRNIILSITKKKINIHGWM